MKFDVQKLLEEIKKTLTQICDTPNTAEQESWWFLEEITKKSSAKILEENEIVLDKTQQETLNRWVQERVTQHKPLQYILGHVPFCNLDILVEPPLLIPRPETEYMVSQIIKELQPCKNKKLNILDLGTGSGCIALALAKAFPNAHVFGIDINEKAIHLAEKNKKHNNILNAIFVCDTFEIHNDVLNNKTFDIIISNPPYVKEETWDTLDNIVKKWEDKHAIVASNSGLYAFKIITKTAQRLLIKHETCAHPQLILEFGMGQTQDVKKFLIASNFKNITIFRDLRGVNRWITASL
jgi:release factor glutamine methyltransferase